MLSQLSYTPVVLLNVDPCLLLIHDLYLVTSHWKQGSVFYTDTNNRQLLEAAGFNRLHAAICQNVLILQFTGWYVSKWAYQDSNLGPHRYQRCALTNWAIRPRFSRPSARNITFVNNYLSELESVNFACKNKKRGLPEFNSEDQTREARFPRIIGKTSTERGILSPLADLIKGGDGKSWEIQPVKARCI